MSRCACACYVVSSNGCNLKNLSWYQFKLSTQQKDINMYYIKNIIRIGSNFLANFLEKSMSLYYNLIGYIFLFHLPVAELL